GMPVIVDGTLGDLIIEPSAAVAEALGGRANRPQAPAASISPRGPAVTRDGTRIRLDANIDRVEDIAVARREHADGIGLFRSELLLNGDGLPGLTGPESERAQAEIYRRAILAMAPRPVTIRTFDLDEAQATSGRAPVDAWPELDRHRVLGLRGVRLGISQPLLLDTQLRAILRAATDGGAVRILVPFVTAPFEMEYVAARLELARRALATEGLQPPRVALGAMLEVPAAALAADHLAEVSDFLAVGTNDLVQYLLAADRTDQRLASLVSGVHPALLRLLRLVPRLAARHAVPVSVCGELASQPTMLALLMGLGVREFSMTPTALGMARRVVESSDLAVLRRVARRAARTGLLADIEHHVEHALAQPATPSAPVAKP
ncbi:MAG: phosphoenolpyruvate--protein phosphotransferase, partial [Vicinamibacteria bacterium]|nr:phosphoenolpyruvate--protein phosphotransferase [Vicinamibacteria bacterium]